MRKEFTSWMEEEARKDKKLVFLTGDLGFNALEKLQGILEDRFINAGVAEQNMISMAAALAYENEKNAQEALHPYCYSIAPFLVFRACEQIRLDICLHNKNVKLIGNGGGFTYGIMGASHHAIDDIAVLSSFSNMKCFIPFSSESVAAICDEMKKYQGPSYLRLGFTEKKNSYQGPILPIVQLKTPHPNSKVTVIGLGPVIQNIAEEDREGLDLFAVTELPLKELGLAFKTSLLKTKKLLIIEDHVQKGGMGEHISRLLLQEGLGPSISQFIHLYASYPLDKSSGSQSYYLETCRLDSNSLHLVLRRMITDID